MAWFRDEGVEQLLKSIGVSFEFRQNIPISKLKIKESLATNARFGNALDEDRIEMYSFSMQAGNKFPAPVLDKDYLILAGNQRTNAAKKAGRQTVDAYVIVKADASQIDDFIRRDNTRHGKSLTEEEKIQTCVELYRKHQIPVKRLNDLYFGGNHKTYERILVANRAKQVEELLLGKNIVASKLSTSALAAMHPLNENINVLRETAMMTLDYDLSSAQVEDIAKLIREKKTEAERLAVVATARQELDQKTKRGVTAQPDVQLRKQMVAFRKFMVSGNAGKQFPSIELISSDKELQKEVRELATELINALKDVKERIK